MIKLYDSELNVMEILWKDGDKSAKEIVKKLKEQVGWSRTTTYTVIKKLVEKGVVERTDPDFICHALISREQVREAEVEHLIGRMFDGSPGMLMNTLLSRKDLPEEMINELKQLVNDLK